YPRTVEDAPHSSDVSGAAEASPFPFFCLQLRGPTPMSHRQSSVCRRSGDFFWSRDETQSCACQCVIVWLELAQLTPKTAYAERRTLNKTAQRSRSTRAGIVWIGL